MRLTIVAGFVFLAFNAMCFVVIIRMNWRINNPQSRKKDWHMYNLRLDGSQENVITEEEYFKDEKRFSVVIVTHNEPLLEKTYPKFRFKT